jgi:hypothetical protein
VSEHDQISELHKTGELELPGEVELPMPTAWPIVLALGFTLVFAGLLTSVSVSVLGAVLTVAGCVGWFREVLPKEHAEIVPVFAEELSLRTERQFVNKIPIAPGVARAWLPLETYPISAGLKGGIAGSAAMAVAACAFGVLKVGSIWYPINLLAAAFYYETQRLTPAQLMSFHWDSFGAALLIHGVVSILVGLLYGAMLPMFSRRPILLGGLLAPALWSILIYSVLGLLNPTLESRINWFWFVASQVAFGVVAGLVVIRQQRVPTWENLPWAVRAGIEAPGMMRTRGGDEDKKS